MLISSFQVAKPQFALNTESYHNCKLFLKVEYVQLGNVPYHNCKLFLKVEYAQLGNVYITENQRFKHHFNLI